MLRVIDVETTDLEGEVIEIGWTDVVHDGEQWLVGQTKSFLTNPGCLIEFGAMATHHVTDEMVKDAPLLSDVLRDHNVLDDPAIEAFVAHNAKYEQARLHDFLPAGMQWICTWKLSQHLAPKFKSHSNQAMRYALKLEVEHERTMPTHRAGPDSYVTACLLVRALNKLSIEAMVEISNKPSLLHFCPIGREWRGREFSKVDSGFLWWIIDNITDNEDLTFTARHHINLRKLL